MSRIEFQDFLKQYNIKDDEFKKTGLKWDELIEIYNNFISRKEEFESSAKQISECLRTIDKVHSVKFRVKDPLHLIEKIIRKKIKDSSKAINLDNYDNQINDLIGLRALHLFKDDWESIHDSINKKWDLYEPVKAYIRKGDNENRLKTKNCDIEVHEYGYRSVHYVVKIKPFKKDLTAEIQVRTIFEEGWSEIDHIIRYPYDNDNPILLPYIMMFNAYAGGADEMGTYVKLLHSNLKEIQHNYEEQLKEKDSIIEELNKKIDNIDNQKVKNDIKVSLGNLSKSSISDLSIGYLNSNNINIGNINAINNLYKSFCILSESIKNVDEVKEVQMDIKKNNKKK